MQNSELETKKKEILGEIFLRKEDTLKYLKELVALSKPFFMVEQESGRIIFNQNKLLKNKNKIALFLIGRYFAKEFGILQNDGIKIADLSDQFGINKTTLSGPLGELVRGGNCRKTADGEYFIVYHKIKPILENLNKDLGE